MLEKKKDVVQDFVPIRSGSRGGGYGRAGKPRRDDIQKI